MSMDEVRRTIKDLRLMQELGLPHAQPVGQSRPKRPREPSRVIETPEFKRRPGG